MFELLAHLAVPDPIFALTPSLVHYLSLLGASPNFDYLSRECTINAVENTAPPAVKLNTLVQMWIIDGNLRGQLKYLHSC